jgi:hypothetical protein
LGSNTFLWKIAIDLRSNLFGSGTGCGYRIGPVLSRRYLFENLCYSVSAPKIVAYHAEFPRQAAASEPHRHNGAELVYVLRGKLSIVVEDEETILCHGDAMYFGSGAAHTNSQHGHSAQQLSLPRPANPRNESKQSNCDKVPGSAH